MVYICIPPIIRLWCASECRSPLEFGEKKCSISGEDLFFGLHLICLPEKNRGRDSSLQMLKIWQNCGKIANYFPLNAQQRSAPLSARPTVSGKLLHIGNYKTALAYYRLVQLYRLQIITVPNSFF